MEKYYEINEKGHNIRCKLYYSDLKNACKAVIFGTGFAGHKDNNAAHGFAEKLLSKHKDVMVVVFNWPAHGDDVKKTISLGDCLSYLDLVISEIKNKFSIAELYSYATSFGGYMMLKYIAEYGNPFRKIALRCPAVNMYDVITGSIMKNDDYDKLLKGKKIQVGFDRKITVTIDFLNELKDNDIFKLDYTDDADNILILHGTKDEVVPFDAGSRFADQNIIEFVPIEGADHRFQNPTLMSLANKYVMQFFDM